MMKNIIISFLFLLGLLITTHSSFAHCDTKDGPVVAAAIKAIKLKNINYALMWVKPSYEKEIKEAFESTMKVRVLSPEAEKLADDYFFETLVRLHRSGEGMAYTGVKPAGTPVDKKILAADKSLALGDLAPLKDLVPKSKLAELKKRFDKAMSLKNYDVNDVPAGRQYVEAYVQFFHFAENEGEHNPGHMEKSKG
jgi:NAD+--asparagine ADP-ribosyltransferase